MKVSAERDIGRCRLALDRVADPFGSRIATTAGIWTPSWVTIRCRRGPEEKACSLDPERRCRLKEAEEIRQHGRQEGGVSNWTLEAIFPVRQFSTHLPPPRRYKRRDARQHQPDCTRQRNWRQEAANLAARIFGRMEVEIGSTASDGRDQRIEAR